MGKDTKTTKPSKATKKDAPAPTKSLKRKTVDDDAPSKESIQPPAKALKSTPQDKAKPAPPKETTKKLSEKTKAPAPAPKSISRQDLSQSKTKKAKKAKTPTPEPSESEDEKDEADRVNVAAEDSSDGEDNDYLAGFSTDEDSSDEEDAMDAEPAPIEVSKLPTVAKDDAAVKRKLEKAKKQPTGDRGVLYVGRIPHGFYEEQMKAYFSQFGDVTRLRLSRNKKTGKPKHYGFVEFESASVAEIVAETMDNYLMMGHLLQCKVIPKEKVHPELWVGANRKWRVVPVDRVQRVMHNKGRTEDERKRINQRLINRQSKKQQKLKDLGINYDLNPVGYKKPAVSES